MTIYIPYAPPEREMDLGAEYNHLIQASPSEYVCFLDHDATWLRADWYDQIRQHLERFPDVGLVTCPATRIGAPQQRWAEGAHRHNHNISELRRAAKRERPRFRTITPREKVSGVVIITSKTAWEKAGGFKSGFLGVDNRYHDDIQAAGLETHQLDGCPVYHWYRGDGDISHLHRARDLQRRNWEPDA